MMYIPPKCPNLQCNGRSNCDMSSCKRKFVKEFTYGRPTRPSWFFFGQIALVGIPICVLFSGFYLSNISALFVLVGGGFMILAIFCAVFFIAPCYRADKCDDYLPLTKSDSSSPSRRVKFALSNPPKTDKIKRQPSGKDSVYCELHAPSTDNLNTSYSFPKINPSDCQSTVKFPLTPIPSQNNKGNCGQLRGTVNKPVTLPCDYSKIFRSTVNPDNLKASLEILCSDQMKKPIEIMKTIKTEATILDATPGDDPSKTGKFNLASLECPVIIKLYPISSQEGTYQWRNPLTTEDDDFRKFYDLLTPVNEPVDRKHFKEKLSSKTVPQCVEGAEAERGSKLENEVLTEKEVHKLTCSRSDKEDKFENTARSKAGTDVVSRANDYLNKKIHEYDAINDELFLDFILNRSLYEECRVSSTDDLNKSLTDSEYQNEEKSMAISRLPMNHAYDPVNKNAVRKQRQLHALFSVSFNDSSQMNGLSKHSETPFFSSKYVFTKNEKLVDEKSDSSTCSPPRTKKFRRLDDSDNLGNHELPPEIKFCVETPLLFRDSKLDLNVDPLESEVLQDIDDRTPCETRSHKWSNANLSQSEAGSQTPGKNRKISLKVESKFFKKSSSLYENVLIEKVIKQKKKTLKQFK